VRRLARRLWPVPKLRWLLLSVLIFAAAMPGIAALGLRVYENALVRRTEAEVSAQAAALGAATALIWPGAQPASPSGVQVIENSRLDPYAAAITTGIDLRTTEILPERPAAEPASGPPDPAALVAAQRIAPAIAETKQATLASIVLLDRDGVMVSGSEVGKSLGQLPEVRAALAGGSQTVMRYNSSYPRGALLHWLSPATDIRLHHARAITVNGEVVGVILVSRSPSALFRGMWEDWGKIAVGAGVIFALILFIAGVLVRAIVVPVERLSAATRALAQGRSAHLRPPTLEVREIRSLNADFTAMADAINRRSRYLRDFAASLSHEFKTPLAGIRGGIELLQDHGAGMSKAERAKFLNNMEGDAQRLSKLVSRLMELAQADMASARGDDHARADAASVLARLADAHNAPGFALTWTIEPDYPALAIEEEALETVLATLFENARQAGASALAVTTGHRGRFASLALTDNGPGVPEADRVRIFDPFFTSRRETGGTGLGLPIARALAESRGGSLELGDGAGGACFVLTLRVAG
jgi:signal transduction histidine kinase